MPKKNKKNKQFRFPFDIDSRYFLWSSILFLLLSIHGVHKYFLPKLTIETLKPKIESYVNDNIQKFEQIIATPELINGIDSQKYSFADLELLNKLPFGFFIDQHDSLVFWNSNTISFPSKKLEINNPSLYQDASGYYICLKKEIPSKRGLFATAVIKIKHEFINSSLLSTSYFIPYNFKQDYDIELDINKPNLKYETVLINNKPVCYIYHKNNFFSSRNENAWLLFLHCLPFIFFGISIHTYFKVTVKERGEKQTMFLMFALVLAIRLCTYLLGFPDNFTDERVFDSTLFATDIINSSLGDTFINMCLIFWISLFYSINLQGKMWQIEKSKYKYIFVVFILILTLSIISYNINLIQELILDGALNFDLTILDNISSISILALLTLLVIFANIVLLAVIFNVYTKIVFGSDITKYVLITVGFLIYLIILKFNGYFIVGYICFLLVFILNDSILQKTRFDFNSYNLLIWIITISMLGSMIISLLVVVKEKQNREEIAKGIIYQNTDYLNYKFEEDVKRIQKDTNIVQLINQSKNGLNIELNAYLFKNYFKIDFLGYMLTTQFREGSDTGITNTFINNKGAIEFLSHIPIPYEANKYLYISLLSSKEFNHYIIDGDYAKTSLNNTLIENNYSIAIYQNDLLVYHSGTYSFNKNRSRVSQNFKYSYAGFKDDESNKEVLIVKQSNFAMLFLTIFSYIFLIYFLTLSLYILGNMLARSNLEYKRFYNLLNVTLRLRMHIAIIVIVFGTLFVFSFSTYKYLYANIQEQLKKDITVSAKFINSKMEYQFLQEKKDSLKNSNSKFVLDSATIFFLKGIGNEYSYNINIFDFKNGNLIFSSKPNFYYSNYLSQVINPLAYYHLRYNGNTNLTFNESIENYKYLSYYSAIGSDSKNTEAIINLQRISSDKSIKTETNKLISSFITIFAFIFFLSSFIAFFISKSVTKSFKMVVKQFTQINLNETNKPLDWAYSDEIGSLVKEYNRMLKKLENSSMQIKQNERELAWREMAKQVAHEIKTPLTPMKITLQTLERLISKKSDNVEEFTKKVSKTLIEQIDNLSLIAANFSDFAKMPELKKEKFVLNDLLKSVTGMYNDNNMHDFLFLIPNYLIYINSDRHQIMRVFTNLIQNAIQSVPVDRKGTILLEVEKIKNNKIRVSISDNGSGIDKQTAAKLFQPYFTTKNSGTGLGLAMCKDIIEKSGGTITFKSAIDEGTTFMVDLPIADNDEN
ncbi:MAG: HAMP domain-containing sensor histidine kinase [Chitinophagaceae bacterium]